MALGSLTLTLPAARAVTVEERLLELEQRIQTLEQENAALKQQTAATAPRVSPMGKATKLAIGGFLHLQGEAGDSPDTRFPSGDRAFIRRARFGVKGTVADDFGFAIQMDLSGNTLGSSTGIRTQLTDAFVTWTRFPAASLTLGQFKVPFGYEQLQSDTVIPTIERTLANDQLTLPRQLGAMISGPLGHQRLTYALALGNGNGANISVNDNDQFMPIGRLAGVVVDTKEFRLAVGANAYTSRDTGTFTGERTGVGFDAQATAGRASVTAEWLQTEFDRDTGTDFDAEGWSVMGVYTFVPQRWQGVLRYEEFDPNTTLGDDRTIIRTVGVNYLLRGDDLKVAVNYLLGQPAGTDDDRGRIVARLQLVF